MIAAIDWDPKSLVDAMEAGVVGAGPWVIGFVATVWALNFGLRWILRHVRQAR